MGLANSSPHRILLLGQPKTGKTRFINLLQFNGDVSDLGRTKGWNQGIYVYGSQEYHFVEFGGTSQQLWPKLLEKQDPFDAVYFFLRGDDTKQRMLQAWSHLLHLLAFGQEKVQGLPLVVVVYREGQTKTNLLPQVQSWLQLKLMSQQRAVLLTEFAVDHVQGLPIFFQYLLDWTHDKVK